MKSFTKSIKVVFDTNIVISALIGKQGQPAKLFEKLILGKIENYTSKEIIQEIEEVFRRKEITKRTGKNAREFVLRQFKKHSIIVFPKITLRIVKEDSKDNKFIECAEEAKADYIISGDSHLTDIKKYQKVRIITPKESEELI